MKQVVGTVFFRDGKLLIVKPSRRPKHQMVGGSVEEGETLFDAAVRECREEMGPNITFDPSKIEYVMDFEETATNDPNLIIHMNLFIYKGEITGELTTSEEIESFMWFGIGDDQSILSNSLKNKVIPYCIENNLIY